MWFKEWFNEDYLNLYSHRSLEEAKKQVEFICSKINCRKKSKVLDLACGTGRHSLAFGLKGLSVVRIDLSKVLIQRAKERLGACPAMDVTFYVSDLFALPDLGTFDLVVNLFTSFGYFESDQKNRQVFSIVSQRLNAQGIFFLDYLHPFSVKKGLVPQEHRYVKGEEVKIERFIKNGVVHKHILFPDRAYEEKVKLYDRTAIEHMLDASGLAVVHAWNDYEGNPWREEGDRQLFLCKKKGG